MVKILHYCWFGGAPLPESVKRYMKTWKKFCPDYVIKCWDENNFDVNSVPFVAEAYAAKKWAFVSDYVRAYALWSEGGLYVDTDVEFIKNIEDLTNTSFIGFEWITYVNPGLILYAATPHEEFFGEVLSKYEKIHFDLTKMEEITSPIVYTDLLVKKGLRRDNSFQRVGNMTIYPMDYFQPMGKGRKKFHITENTRTIHHYDASWYEDKDKLFLKYRKKYGEKSGRLIFILVHPILAFKRFLNVLRSEK